MKTSFMALLLVIMQIFVVRGIIPSLAQPFNIYNESNLLYLLFCTWIIAITIEESVKRKEKE